MADDLDRLETLAKAATPGPWVMDDDQQTSYPVVRTNEGIAIAGCPTNRLTRGRINTEFIAAADPQTVLALIAELRAARTFRDEVTAALVPGRWRGFDGPDGVSIHEIIADVATALRRYDEAVGHADR